MGTISRSLISFIYSFNANVLALMVYNALSQMFAPCENLAVDERAGHSLLPIRLQGMFINCNGANDKREKDETSEA